MDGFLIMVLALIVGFLTGGVVVLSACKDEAKSGTLHLGGKTYRLTPIERA